MKSRLRTTLASLWLILFAGCVVRLGYAWLYAEQTPHQALAVIPFTFEPGNIAYSIAQGHGFASPLRVDTGPTAWAAPVYPYLLAAIFRLFGSNSYHSWIAAALVNILFVTLATVPIFFSGKRIGGVGLGALAAWLWTLYPNAMLIPIQSMWDASLDALLAATIVWATLKLGDSSRVRNWGFYGLLWGLTLLTDPTLVSLLPFLLAWLGWKMHKQEMPWVKQILLAVAIALLCCVPWTIRNYRIFHAFVPIRTDLGLQLWLGNNAISRGGWPGRLHPIDNSTERDAYIHLGEIRYMRAKRDAAIRFMLHHPMAVGEWSSARFVSFWSGGSELPWRDFLSNRSLWFRTILLFDILAGIAALVGCLLLIARRSAFFMPLAVFPFIYPVAYYLTLALPRYRLPIDPVVLLLAAITLRGVNMRAAPEVEDQMAVAGQD